MSVCVGEGVACAWAESQLRLEREDEERSAMLAEAWRREIAASKAGQACRGCGESLAKQNTSGICTECRFSLPRSRLRELNASR